MWIILRPGVSENKSLSRYNSQRTVAPVTHHYYADPGLGPGGLWSLYGGNTVCDVRIKCRETRSHHLCCDVYDIVDLINCTRFILSVLSILLLKT